MMSWAVSIVSGKGRILFIVASRDIIVPTPFTNVLSGVFVVLLLSSWVFRFE
jgi:hypothetical protein